MSSFWMTYWNKLRPTHEAVRYRHRRLAFRNEVEPLERAAALMRSERSAAVERFEKVFLTIACGFVPNVPNITRDKITIRSRHRLFLEAHFQRQKAASKPLKDAFYATLWC